MLQFVSGCCGGLQSNFVLSYPRGAGLILAGAFETINFLKTFLLPRYEIMKFDFFTRVTKLPEMMQRFTPVEQRVCHVYVP